MKNDKTFHISLLLAFVLLFIWSAINPKDYFTWLLEVLPAVIGLFVLIFTYKKFKFSKTTYFFILVQASILVIGGHYTYAEMPLFNWIRDTLGLQRNYFDRLGHFFQGFTPALISLEILMRQKILNKKNWLPFIVICICLSISVVYEFSEWGASVIAGDAATDFLGTQGDIWDTQWDMFMAFIGASMAMIIYFKRYRDKLLSEKRI